MTAPLWSQRKRLLKLEPNWNGEGARPIDPANLAKAERLMKTIKESQPYVVPTAEGGVYLEWHTKEFDIGIGVPADDDGNMAYIIDQTNKNLETEEQPK